MRRLKAKAGLVLVLGLVFIWSQSAVPAESTAEQAVKRVQDLPAGPGKGYVETLCTPCHSLEKILMQRRTKDEWLAVVGKMVGEQGAQISEWEIEQIVEYLGEHLSPLREHGMASYPAVDERAQQEVDWAMLLPEGGGKEFVLVHCASCHGLEIIVKNRKSEEAWYNTVTWMIDEFSAPVPEQDVHPIVDYLAVHAGENNAITGVPMDLNTVPAEVLQRLGFLSSEDIHRLLHHRSQKKFRSMEEYRKVLNLKEEAFRFSRIYLEVR